MCPGRRGEWVAQLPFFPPLQDWVLVCIIMLRCLSTVPPSFPLPQDGTALDVAECGRIIEELVGGLLADPPRCSRHRPIA